MQVDPNDVPLFEKEYGEPALINAADYVKARDVPSHCVVTFFREVVERVRVDHAAEEAYRVRSEMGEFPLLRFEYDGKPLAMILCGVGAPLAVGMLEEIIAAGCRYFVVCGGAGVVDSSIDANRVIVPTAAVRDEGVSYHYLPPSREVAPTDRALAAVRECLSRKGIAFTEGKTWTTDAFFRETPSIIEKRRRQGCLCVEMEAAGLFAAARYRGVELAQMVYAGDDVGGELWDPRDWHKQTGARERLFHLAAEACLSITAGEGR